MDGANVLVTGQDENRVSQIIEWINEFPLLRTTTSDGEMHSSDPDVIVLVDRSSDSRTAVENLQDWTRAVGVFNSEYQRDSPWEASLDCILLEPIDPRDLRSVVGSFARQVCYDQRLRECAKLATQYGQIATDDGNQTLQMNDHGRLRDRISDVRQELADIQAEFTNDDFRQAFERLAAD